MKMIKSLFDFKFDNLVAPKVLRFLYSVFAVCSAIGIVIGTIVGMKTSILSIILIPLIGFVYLLIVRIIYEALIVKFQMAQDIRAIKNKYVSTP